MITTKYGKMSNVEVDRGGAISLNLRRIHLVVPLFEREEALTITPLPGDRARTLCESALHIATETAVNVDSLLPSAREPRCWSIG
jgi:hypothetical protein